MGRLDRNNPEVFDNTVASLVDMTSILFAYQIGVNGFGVGAGVLYACFDAFIVVWMRKPIARFARSISPFRSKAKPSVATQLGGEGKVEDDENAAGKLAPFNGES